MKNKVLAILTFLLIIFSSNVIAVGNPVLKATLLRYDPTPAQAGDYITAYIQIENIGEKAAQYAKIEFKENYPFSMDNTEESTVDIGLLGIGQSFITDFRVRVNKDALEGTNQLKFLITDNRFIGDLTEKSFNINIQTLDADIEIKEVNVVPAEIRPGEKGKITIMLENKADSPLTDVSTQLVVYSVSGTTITDQPFAIQDSVSEKSFEIMDGGEKRTIEYEIISYPTVTPGIYKVPLKLTFFDGTGQKYNKTEYITLIVNPKVALDIIIEQSTLTKETKSGEIDFRIVNRGFGEIKFANLKLLESDSYELLTPYNTVYIGNIDSDDYESTDFKIKANTDIVNIPIQLEYMDSLNKGYKTEQTLTLTLQSTNGGSGGHVKLILFLVIAAVAGYWFYRRKKKKKR